MKLFVVLLAVAAAASALPTQENEHQVPQAAASEIHLAEGITIVRNEEEVTAAGAEGAPRALDDSIIGRAARYLQSHSLKVDLKGADVVDAVSAVGRALNGDDSEEARAKGVKVKKAGKLLGPLLIGILLKAALLAPLVLGAIALIAGKALIIGKIALLLSAVIGLKKLLSGHQKAVTYEVVSHPHSYSSHDTYSAGSSSPGVAAGSSGSYSGSSSSGWGRSVDAHQMAYAKQAP